MVMYECTELYMKESNEKITKKCCTRCLRPVSVSLRKCVYRVHINQLDFGVFYCLKM